MMAVGHTCCNPMPAWRAPEILGRLASPSDIAAMGRGTGEPMTDTFPGITTAINLLESARMMRYPAELRRNLTLARSVLYDTIVELDARETPRSGPTRESVGPCGRSTVMIRCPVRGTEIATDIAIDEESYKSALFEDNQIKCSSCGQWHQWSTKDAFLR